MNAKVDTRTGKEYTQKMEKSVLKESVDMRNSLAVQWLGLSTFTAGARVWSLVGELRYCKSCSMVKKPPKKQKNKNWNVKKKKKSVDNVKIFLT